MAIESQSVRLYPARTAQKKQDEARGGAGGFWGVFAFWRRLTKNMEQIEKKERKTERKEERKKESRNSV